MGAGEGVYILHSLLYSSAHFPVFHSFRVSVVFVYPFMECHLRRKEEAGDKDKG